MLGTHINGERTDPKFRRICIIWDWYVNLHVIRWAPPLELRSNFNHVFYSAPPVTFDSRLDPDKRLNRCRKSVWHQFKLSIWRDERNCSVVLEAGKAHALVKLDVFHLNGFPSGSYRDQVSTGGLSTATTYFARCSRTSLCHSILGVVQAYRKGNTSSWPPRGFLTGSRCHWHWPTLRVGSARRCSDWDIRVDWRSLSHPRTLHSCDTEYHLTSRKPRWLQQEERW